MDIHTPHTIGRYIIWLALIAVLCVGLYLLSGNWSAESVPSELADVPPYTPEIQAQLAASTGFAMLVSYTDEGFEPQIATIAAGETVRFTNNSSGDMWVAAGTEMGSIYPGQGTCGQSPFDICKTIGRSMFWEFTFEEAGTWGYRDNSNPAKTGAVVVE